MKRIILLLVVFLFTGCSKPPEQEYKQAHEVAGATNSEDDQRLLMADSLKAVEDSKFALFRTYGFAKRLIWILLTIPLKRHGGQRKRIFPFYKELK